MTNSLFVNLVSTALIKYCRMYPLPTYFDCKMNIENSLIRNHSLHSPISMGVYSSLKSKLLNILWEGE